MCCHNLPVHRAVVFQGINTGRRFYGCANQVSCRSSLVVIDYTDPCLVLSELNICIFCLLTEYSFVYSFVKMLFYQVF